MVGNHALILQAMVAVSAVPVVSAVFVLVVARVVCCCSSVHIVNIQFILPFLMDIGMSSYFLLRQHVNLKGTESGRVLREWLCHMRLD